jgi:hypothetical protein
VSASPSSVAATSDSAPRYQKTPEWRTAKAKVEGSGWARYVPEKGWAATVDMSILLDRDRLFAGLTAQPAAL